MIFVLCFIGIIIFFGFRFGNKNWVVFWLIFLICNNMFSCFFIEIGIVLWLKCWFIKNRWILVVCFNKEICESREKKVFLIFLLIFFDRVRILLIIIVRWVNWWLGLLYKIVCCFWMRVVYWFNCLLICEIKFDFEWFLIGCIIVMWFFFVYWFGVLNLGLMIIKLDICFSIFKK